MRKITTLAAFKAFLTRHGVKYQKWGIGPTKTVERLFYEYLEGLTRFEVRKGKLVRIVRRVQVLVYYRRNGIRYFLIEKQQVFQNGGVRTRSRLRSLSEKLTLGEDKIAGALRALYEELGMFGVEPSQLRPLQGQRRGRAYSSQSYPGLPTIHYGPRFRFDMPRHLVQEAGYVERQADKTTYFSWTKPRRRLRKRLKKRLRGR